MGETALRNALLAGLLILSVPLTAEQIIPVALEERPAAHDVRLRNASAADAMVVSLTYDAGGHVAGVAQPILVEAAATIVLEDVVRALFGMTTDTLGEIRVQAPDGIEVHWRRRDAGLEETAWLPAIHADGEVRVAGSSSKRRAVCSGCRVEPPTLVKAGDVATFAGPYGVSGVATILDKSTIRVTALRANGTAPGIDFRIGLSTTSRQSFVVLRTTGRQVFQNATLDLVLPQGVDLNSFDTFTVWCFEFRTIIAEGKFRRP